jgi:flagellar biosynthesis protein FlhA
MESPDNLLAQTVKIRQKLKEELGYVIPLIQFNNSDDLMQNEFAIKLHGVEVLRDIVFPNYVAYFKDELKGYTASKDDYITEDAVTERKLIWIHQDKVKDFWQHGFTAVEYIGRVIEYISIKEVSDIMDYNDVNSYIEIVLEHNSFLVDNIIPDFITAADLKYLLTCLVRERVSIKNIIYLFEKINDYANEPTKEDLLDKVRLAFSKQIMKDLSKEGEVKLIELEEDTVEAFAAFVENEDEDSVVRINADDVILIADKIKKLAKSKKAQHIILIAPMSLRHMIYVILSEFIPAITVLAAEEVMAITDIKIIGKV